MVNYLKVLYLYLIKNIIKIYFIKFMYCLILSYPLSKIFKTIKIFFKILYPCFKFLNDYIMSKLHLNLQTQLGFGVCPC